MNLIILSKPEFLSPDSVRLTGRKYKHIRDVHRAGLGDRLKVGLENGLIGEGRVTHLSEHEVELQVTLTAKPPQPLPLTLFLALPRPKTVPRILHMATNLGIKKIFLINSARVEKIYWSCEQLSLDEIKRACLLGLEQAGDTVLPEVNLERLFKPFVEDELPEIIRDTTAFVAHPYSTETCPHQVPGAISLFIGPEGGFIDYEIEMLAKAGVRSVRSLTRILKIETALASLVGRLI